MKIATQTNQAYLTTATMIILSVGFIIVLKMFQVAIN